MNIISLIKWVNERVGRLAVDVVALSPNSYDTTKSLITFDVLFIYLCKNQ